MFTGGYLRMKKKQNSWLNQEKIKPSDYTPNVAFIPTFFLTNRKSAMHDWSVVRDENVMRVWT